jgi:hypothetical protein
MPEIKDYADKIEHIKSYVIKPIPPKSIVL